MNKYPDVTELINRKNKQRRSLASLPFEKKIQIVFKLRERRRFIKSGKMVDDSGRR